MMAEQKNDESAQPRDKKATEQEMTLHQPQQLRNGTVPSFQSPAQLDSWFDAQLMQVYSEVVSEPLPREFLDLLQKLKDKKSAR